MLGKIFRLLATVLLATGSFAEAQQQKKVPRIGYLSSNDPANDSFRSKPFLQALRELGYIEGQTITIEYRYGSGKQDKAPELAAELVHSNVIVVSGASEWVRAAMNASKTVPVVMMGVGPDPVSAGLIQSLARPGGNVTGVTNLGRELGGKRLELFKEAVPKLVRIAVLYDPAIPGTTREVKNDLPVSARTLGLTIRSWQLPDADGLEKVFAALNKDRPGGLYVPGGGLLMSANMKRIAHFALTSRLPSLGNTTFTQAGGLMAYNADPTDSYRRVATYVDKILKGAKPADLPVEQPTKFELVINLKTAKEIGVTIPQSMLYRADRVIK
jgi:putative ABC transport system substrate-binding protein